ncbi:Os01g0784101 [Oryza sativa Japonica Group]|uniref:Os01g0784101 protein n=1 Tax=Oryza sativa subsp. japonica TaxID=39947 RepID=A0A0P0V946_ORYSJ|nr:hypothetical protein EE612_006133 [Oryza sativa]BAS74674.1 Os01g0784101 [Oryza sativa Japonica Group]
MCNNFLTCGVQGVYLGLREPDVDILHDPGVLPHVQQIDGPDDAPAADPAACVRRGVRPAAAVAQAHLPALVQRHAGVHRRVRRRRQLHPVHRPEPVAGAVAGEVGRQDAPARRVPEAPLLRRPRLEPRQAAAQRGRAGVAVAERPALGVAVARVGRVVPEAAPRAVDPHEALHLPRRRVGHEPGEQRRVEDGVAVVRLVGARDHREGEVLGLEVRHARELRAVPRPAPVDHRRAAEEEELRQAAGNELERVRPRRGVGRARPRRHVPGDAVLDVHPELHPREQGVRRVVEALPRHASGRPGAHDEVAVVLEPSGGAGGGYVPRRSRGRPHGGVLRVGDDKAAVGGQPGDGGDVDDRVLPVGDPHDGLAGDAGVPNAEIRPAVGGAIRDEETELKDATGRDERLVAGDEPGLADDVGGGSGA